MRDLGISLGLLSVLVAASADARAQPAASFETSLAAHFSSATAITVRVERRVGGRLAGHGSGVVVSGRGLVATAGHVVTDRDASYRVVFPDGSRARVRRVHRHPERDLALLRTGATTRDYVRHRGEPRTGEWLVCSGFVSSHASTQSLGVLAELDFAWTVYEPGQHWRGPSTARTLQGMLRSDCPTGRGMSGGAVLDLQGHLLGIIVGGGVAEPASELLSWATDDLELPLAPAERAATSPPVVDGSRVASLRRLVDAGDELGRSVVVIERADGRTFHGVVASDGGHVVTVAEAIGDSATDPLRIVGQPDAALAEMLGVAGELALVRFDDLVGRPVDPHAATLSAGELIAAVPTGQRDWSVGVVGHAHGSPGRVLPQIRQGGCGFMQNRRRTSRPAVEVGDVMSHDASPAARGSLLVARDGRPAGIHVVTESAGASYAVSWPEVLRRFPALRARTLSRRSDVAP